MSRVVKYADPYPVIGTKVSTPSYGSRTMKSVTNKQIIINKEYQYPPLDVRIIHSRPKYVSTYNSISGYPYSFDDQKINYVENKQFDSDNIPLLSNREVVLDAVKNLELPEIKHIKEEVEVLANGEVVPRGENVKNIETNDDMEYDDMDQTGEGIFDSIKNAASKVADRVTGTAKAIFKGQSRLQPPERKLMEQYGEKVITKIVIQRAPIKTVPVDNLMNLITGGNFNKSLKEYGYDKLFHLFMIITLEDLTEISLEKNETIQMKKSPQKSDYESLNVSLSGKVITLNELMEKTSNLMGSNFFPYHPINNNCQTFISSVMKAIGLNTSQIDTFVNQPVDKLFETYDKSGKLTNWMAKITQLGTKMNFLKRGGKIHYKMHS